MSPGTERGAFSLLPAPTRLPSEEADSGAIGLAAGGPDGHFRVNSTFGERLWVHRVFRTPPGAPSQDAEWPQGAVAPAPPPATRASCSSGGRQAELPLPRGGGAGHFGGPKGGAKQQGSQDTALISARKGSPPLCGDEGNGRRE